MIDKRAAQMVNQAYDIKDVLRHFTGYAPTADTLRCPFHDDNRKSAKIYRDADGDRLYCFTEAKMYRVTDLITVYGGDIGDWITPEMRLQTIQPEEVELDLSPLDPFRKGEIDISEVLLRTINLKPKPAK